MIIQIKSLANQYYNEIVEIRRHLHQYPELSFREHKTSMYIKDVLKKWNISYIDGIANTGIIVVLRGKNPKSKVVALRADFDALPIHEDNDVAYCSKNNGVMHACGHDAHTASLLGTVKILNELREYWEGTIKCIFQPAEEMLPGGAKQMIKEGVLENPQVNKMLGQHVFPDLEVGKVGFKCGKYMASTDELYISVKGKGGHAALPEKNNNPIIATASLITCLDKFFARNNSKDSVFAIGYINGIGSTNIIPESVELKGTFRAIDEEYRLLAHKQMLDISYKKAKDYNVKIDFEIRKGYPCLINDKILTKNSIRLAKSFLGDHNVVLLPVRMTAEDFAYYSHEVSSCFYRLGTANFIKGITNGLHTSKFDIDEESLKTGMGLMAYLAINS